MLAGTSCMMQNMGILKTSRLERSNKALNDRMTVHSVKEMYLVTFNHLTCSFL